MKPPSKPQKKIPDLRVTRKNTIHLAHADGHGWAVSYADLLMVLLSFFVLYFSFSDKPESDMDLELRKISLSMQGLSAGEIEKRTRKPDSVEVTKLSDALKIEGVKVSQIGDSLLLELETSAFKSGSYSMDQKMREQVDAVLTHLKPFESELSMTVIGHTDGRKLIPRNEFLTDNFDLSSIRALRVMKYMVHNGFPENKASARAASSFDREARSITFEIHLANPPKAGGDA